MKRHAIVIAGLLSLCVALPGRAQAINSSFPGGLDIMDTLPFGAYPTPPAPQFANLWGRTVTFLNELLGLNDSTTVPVITTISGPQEPMTIPTSSAVYLFPEQQGQASLVDYPSMRRLYP